MESTKLKRNDVDHIKTSADQVSHDYQSDIDVPNNKTTLTLNDDLWKQVTQMNDANLLGSLTYTTKAQQPFKIAYDYTKNGSSNLRPASSGMIVKAKNESDTFDTVKEDEPVHNVLLQG
ncbi:MAG: hypothetical protein ACRC0Q_04380 [Kurthia gibsonii]